MPSDQIVLVRDCDPVLRQANPCRGRELYEAGQGPPLLRTMGKHYPS